jgi:Wax ester synthase-like Acyl-CoA acyltransferase domain
MAVTTPMSAQDALWLTMDRPNNLMVVDGAMMLAHAPDLEAVRAVFRAAVDRFPVLRRRAVRRGVGWAWQDDPAFDLDQHVTELELPVPHDMAALQRFVPSNARSPTQESPAVAGNPRPPTAIGRRRAGCGHRDRIPPRHRRRRSDHGDRCPSTEHR